jgi:hypothetical protein
MKNFLTFAGVDPASRAVTMPRFIATQEIVLLVVLLLLIFGTKRLPEIGSRFPRTPREVSPPPEALPHGSLDFGRHLGLSLL